MAISLSSALVGSSPRARGTPHRRRVPGRHGRFIPACAGNTKDANGAWHMYSVHPRVRGEHGRWRLLVRLCNGSSPRARGTHLLGLERELANRFIPACAGNTNGSTVETSPSPVHPRVRGEHALSGSNVKRGRGSSPRARGTPLRQSGDGLIRRFIPACAGNTPPAPPDRPPGPVHPRVRGEHVHDSRVILVACGSSPRARGTRSAASCRWSRCRFIPACAGNTGSRRRGIVVTTVHPRVRGEHLNDIRTAFADDGSSPRARGTLGWAGDHGTGQRFIPACAGNTLLTPQGKRSSTVHPRVVSHDVV